MVLTDACLGPFLRLSRIKFGALFRPQSSATLSQESPQRQQQAPLLVHHFSASGKAKDEKPHKRRKCHFADVLFGLAIGATTAGAVTVTKALLDYEDARASLAATSAGRLFMKTNIPIFLPVNSVPVMCGGRPQSLTRSISIQPQCSVDLVNSEQAPSGSPAAAETTAAQVSTNPASSPGRTISTQTSEDSLGAGSSSTSSGSVGVLDVRGCLFNMIGLDFAHQHVYNETVSHFKRAADLGYAKAQFNLGMCMYKGLGTRKDAAGAVEIWEEAAKQGHGQALYQLAALELMRDSKSAKGHELMRRAVRAGVPQAKQFFDEAN